MKIMSNFDEKIKPSFNENRQCLGKVLPLSTPFTIMADISDVCNFKCNYCFRGMGKHEKYYGHSRLMSKEIFTKIVDQALEFDGRIRRFSLSHNGEPLAHPGFAEFVEYAKKKDVADSVEIHTNASLLNKDLCRKIINSGLDRMVISLQGMDAKKYNEICGVNIDYDRFYNNIQFLYKEKRSTSICIKIVDTALNEDEKEIFYERFAPIADRVYIETVVPLWDVKEGERNSNDQTNNKYGIDYKKQNMCPLMFYTINILPDGTIFPCTNITPPMILGNIHDNTLKECWESKKRRNFIIEQLKNTRDCNRVCKNCYIPQNTVLTENDIVDGYEKEILERIQEQWM